VENEGYRPESLIDTSQAVLGILDESVGKWDKILEGEGEDNGVANCPLCIQFTIQHYARGAQRQYSCKYCPVKIKTGRQWCGGTPYKDWVLHQENKHGVMQTPYDKVGECCIPFVQAERDFLHDLAVEIRKLQAP
jgi:hypothetical protein